MRAPHDCKSTSTAGPASLSTPPHAHSSLDTSTVPTLPPIRSAARRSMRSTGMRGCGGMSTLPLSMSGPSASGLSYVSMAGAAASARRVPGSTCSLTQPQRT